MGGAVVGCLLWEVAIDFSAAEGVTWTQTQDRRTFGALHSAAYSELQNLIDVTGDALVVR